MAFVSRTPVKLAVGAAGAESARALREISARERQVIASFTEAANALSASVDSAVIRQLLSNGAAPALGALDFGGFAAALQPMVDAMSAQVIAGGIAGVRDLPTSVQGVMSFNKIDPRAIAWAQSRAGQLIVQVNDEQRLILKDVIARSVENGWTVDQTAADLKSQIGLHNSWATAVSTAKDRELARLLKTGMNPALAEQGARDFAARYRDRLLGVRAQNIARTELMTAANQGRYLSWAQGVESGYISGTAKKQWITGSLGAATGRKQVCDICRGLADEIVPWDKEFSVGVSMPPAHPSCRCTSVLVPVSVGELSDRVKSPADVQTGKLQATGDTQEILNRASKADISQLTTEGFDAFGHNGGYIERQVKIESHEYNGVMQYSTEFYDTDSALNALTKALGIGDPPVIASSAEVDSALAQGGREIHRGFGNEVCLKSFLGDAYESGCGISGSGFYTSTKGAASVRNYVGTTNGPVRMVLKPDAKIINLEDLRALTEQVRLEASDLAKIVSADPSRTAATAGYDAVFVDYKGKDFIVVLNRNALLVDSGTL